MFSDGQRLFALFFVVAFFIVMIMAYRKDRKKNEKYFQGSYKVIIGVVVVYIVYFVLSKVLH